jgi:uncharacterized protein with HEPN domain
MRRDWDRLLDVAEAARAIGRFIEGRDEHSFTDDDLVRSAVCAKLAIIGEAVRNLSPSFTDAHPAIPWRQKRDVLLALAGDAQVQRGERMALAAE